jgi:hypothetical protein
MSKSIEELAPIFSEQAYNMLGSKSKDKRMNKINENISSYGYKVVPEASNRDILTVDNGTNRFIAHRGTAANDKHKAKSDIMADLTFALGKEHHDKTFKQRRKFTDKIVKATQPDKKIILTGHSLGGGTSAFSMEKKSIRDRVDQAHTYNPAISPFTKSPGKKVIKELNEKVTHHRVQGDVVSASATPNYGKVKTYQASSMKKLQKKIPNHLANAISSLDVLNNHSLDNFII